MSTERNNSVAENPGPTRTAANRVDDERLLDAVRDCVLSVGVRRTTLTDVARTAGVSRMTLYRRFPDVRSLVTALMAREFGGLLQRAAESGARLPSARARLVEATMTAIRLLSENAVMDTMLERDPELLLPYLVQRIGRAHAMAEEYIAAFVAEGHADGSIRPADPAVQARVVLYIAHAFTFSARPATSNMDKGTLLSEVRRQLDAALAPGDST